MHSGFSPRPKRRLWLPLTGSFFMGLILALALSLSLSVFADNPHTPSRVHLDFQIDSNLKQNIQRRLEEEGYRFESRVEAGDYRVVIQDWESEELTFGDITQRFFNASISLGCYELPHGFSMNEDIPQNPQDSVRFRELTAQAWMLQRSYEKSPTNNLTQDDASSLSQKSLEQSEIAQSFADWIDQSIKLHACTPVASEPKEAKQS